MAAAVYRSDSAAAGSKKEVAMQTNKKQGDKRKRR
jgi:hypothetical protein